MSDETKATDAAEAPKPSNVPAWQEHFRGGHLKTEVTTHVDGTTTTRVDN